MDSKKSSKRMPPNRDERRERAHRPSPSQSEEEKKKSDRRAHDKYPFFRSSRSFVAPDKERIFLHASLNVTVCWIGRRGGLLQEIFDESLCVSARWRIHKKIRCAGIALRNRHVGKKRKKKGEMGTCQMAHAQQTKRRPPIDRKPLGENASLLGASNRPMASWVTIVCCTAIGQPAP